MDLPARGRRWLVVVLAVIAGAAIAAAVATAFPQDWRASTRILVGRAAGATSSVEQLADRQQAQRLSALAMQPAVLDAVRERTRWQLTPQQMSDAVRASVVTGLPAVSVDVVLQNGVLATTVANAIADEATSRAGSGLGASTQTIRAGELDTQRVGLPRRAWAVFGGLVGALVGVPVLLLLRRRARRLRTDEQLAGLIELPTVVLTRTSTDAAAGAPLPPAVVAAIADRRVIAVGGATAEDDSASAALQLTWSLAASGLSVVLVDGDLAHGDLSDRLGLPRTSGLSDALSGRANVLDTVQAWGAAQHRLAVVPAGYLPARPGALLLSPQVPVVLGLLQDESNVVVVHLPPVLAGADGVILGAQVGAVVLVARSGITTRSSIQAAARALQAAGASVRAAVLLVEEGSETPARHPGRFLKTARRLLPHASADAAASRADRGRAGAPEAARPADVDRRARFPLPAGLLQRVRQRGTGAGPAPAAAWPATALANGLDVPVAAAASSAAGAAAAPLGRLDAAEAGQFVLAPPVREQPDGGAARVGGIQRWEPWPEPRLGGETTTP